jgi:hypothetical protein
VRGDWETASRGDLLLFRKAIKEDWPVPPERRRPLLDAALSPISREDSTPRQRTAAGWLALTALKHDIEMETAELRRSKRKGLVEQCLSLSARGWARLPQSGTWSLENPSITVGYSFDSDFALLRLHYWLEDPAGGQPEYVACSVHMEAQPTRFGGGRWWFHCPLMANGAPCTARVGKLYLPPGRRYFGCRHCHRLTYISCRRSRKRRRMRRGF